MKISLLVICLLFFFKAIGQSLGGDSKSEYKKFGANSINGDQLLAKSQDYTYHSINTDSALTYAKQAYDEYVATGNKTGSALALLMLADIHGRLLGKVKTMEEYSRESLNMLEKTSYWKEKAFAHRLLFLSFSLQGVGEETEKTIEKASQISIQHNDQIGLGWSYWLQGFSAAKKGLYWKAFMHLTESSAIGKETGDSALTAISLVFIARAFNYAGDPKSAVQYYLEGMSYNNNAMLLLWPHLDDLGYAYFQLKQYDSALYYQKKHLHNLDSLLKEPKVHQRFASLARPDFMPGVYLSNKQYDAALQTTLPRLKNQREGGDMFGLMFSLATVATAYKEKKAFARALPFARELMWHGSQSGNDYFRREASLLLSLLFRGLKQNDSAFLYFQDYTTIKDSMETARFLLRTGMYAHAAESNNRIRLLNKDKFFQQQQLLIKDKEIQKSSQLQRVLIFTTIGVILFGLIMLRNGVLKRKNERLESQKKQAQLEKKALEMELLALRAQMNPHFIFNCLSAIDSLVQTNQSEKAATYLALFAKLIRALLESSKHNEVPFHKDYESMKLYLEMEQFRCNYKFKYDLQVDKLLLNGNYKVPPMIIQPFIENAIHHGLLNKPGNNRHLTISARLKQAVIEYSIVDNGIGRKKAAMLKERNRPEHQSYGIQISRERINLYNNSITGNDVQIDDLENNGMPEGTKAIVRISTKNLDDYDESDIN